MIYFDNAATTNIKPRTVYEAVNNALRNYSANPGRSGHNLSLKTSQMIFETREKIANFFNAKSYENVVFTQNCTMSINLCMRGLFKSGDRIIISDLEHNSVFRTAYYLHNKGVAVDVFKVEEDDESTLFNIRKLIKPETKGIVCTHGSNVFGIKLPIEKIGKLCKENQLVFVVDCAQTAGIVDVDIKNDNIDYLCVAPHKGLYAPMGIGILITDSLPDFFLTGGTGSNSAVFVQPNFLPDKFESGTINVPAIAGVSAGLDFVSSKKEFIYKKEKEIIDFIYNNFLRNKIIELYNKPELPVLSFNVENKSSDEVSDYLNSNNICVRSGLHCAPLAHKKFGTEGRGTVRISPSCFNSMKEAEYLVSTIKKI